jgi:hypothetical protein
VARASVASPTFVPPSCRRFHRYYLRKPDGILLLVDALWFGSLGYGDVFRKTLSIRWAIFAASFAATFFILYGWFLALRRAYQPDLLSSGIIYIARQPVKLPGERILRLIAVIVTLLVAAATAAAMSGGNGRRLRSIGTCRAQRRNCRSNLRQVAAFLSVPAPRLAADYGVATDAGGDSCGIAIFIILTTGSFQVFAGRVHGLQ